MPGIGWARGYRTKSKTPLLLRFPETRGIFLHAISDTLLMCVCVYVGGFAVDARTLSLGSLILSHFPLGE